MRSVSIALVLALSVPIAAQDGARPPAERFAILGTCPEDGSAALLKTGVLAYDQIDNAPEEKERGITISTTHVEYQTVSCHERADLFTEIVTGESRPDTAIALVTPRGGVADARRQIFFAAYAGIPRMVVFVNDVKLADADDKELTLALGAAGFDGDKTPIIRGSALGAVSGRFEDQRAIASLIAVTRDVPPPDLKREKDKPFLMPVDDVYAVAGGAAVTGRVEQGIVRVDDFVDVEGLGVEKLQSSVTGIEMFRKLLDTGEAGDNVTLRLRGIDKKDIRRGMVIAKPGSVSPHKKFKGSVYILTKEEGGRHTPFHNTMQLTTSVYTADVEADVAIVSKRAPQPGGVVQVEVTLIVPVAMDKGLRFAIREGGRTVGAGVVSEILE